MNSLIAPLNSAANAATNFAAKNLGLNMNSGANSTGPSTGMIVSIVILLLIVAAAVTVFYYFGDQLEESWNSVKEVVLGYFGEKKEVPAPEPPKPSEQPTPEEQTDASHPDLLAKTASTVEKVLPGGNEVFNVSSNKFTYYDAQPLCKAFGAELATYDQVKEAWKKGADWCNYGWVKGQMAVYPTSEETFAKLQGGPEEQRMSCGTPGVNGGYFDNPELRFGVNCYGKRPAEKQHDASELSKNAPISPDALAFDKKVNKFKSEIDTIPISPFSGH